MKTFVLGAAVATAVLTGAVAFAQPKLIGIANFGEHHVLTETMEGFKDAVRKSGLDVRYHYQQADFKRDQIRSLLEQIQAEKPQLILTVTSPVTRRAIRIVDKSIPLVFSASTVDPVAANFVPSFDRGGERHTGASMMPNFDVSLTFVKQLLPNAKRIGTLFDANVERDLINSEELIAAGKRIGLEVVTQAIEQKADIPVRIRALQPRIDALFLISSNIVQGSLPEVAQVTAELKLPTVNTLYSADLKDRFAGFHTISYRKNGERAGDIAVRILKGENPSTIPVYLPKPDDFVAFVSRKGLAAMGLQVPDGLKSCNCFVPE